MVHVIKSSISNPTLIITGTEDITSPSANSPLLLERIPGAWLVQIENGRQRVIKYQFPEKFSKIVETFLSTAP